MSSKDEIRQLNTERIIRAKAEKLFLKEITSKAKCSAALTGYSAANNYKRLQEIQEDLVDNYLTSIPSRGNISTRGTSDIIYDRVTSYHMDISTDSDKMVEFTSRAENICAFTICAAPQLRISGNGVVRGAKDRFKNNIINNKRNKHGKLLRSAHEPLRSGGCVSVWTAAADGSLAVRCGDTLATAVEIPSKGDGSVVTKLYCTSTGHIWVGYDNGAVKVYDGIVCVLLVDANYHQYASVTVFIEMFDGKVISGASDGSLIKWGNDEHRFAALSRLSILSPKCDMIGERRPFGEGVSALAVNGFSLFVGCTRTGYLVTIDTQEEIPIGVFEAEGSTGCDILCLAVADGYLFSGHSNCHIFVWNMDSYMCVHQTFVPLTSAPVSMSIDMIDTPKSTLSKNQRLWIMLENGTIQIWSTVASERFAIKVSVPGFSGGAPIRNMQTTPNWESTRIFSIGSNGISKNWCSMIPTGRMTLLDTIDVLREVIAEDEEQLSSLSDAVRTLKRTGLQERIQRSVVILQKRMEVMIRRVFYRWWVFVFRRRNAPHIALISSSACRAMESSLCCRYLCKWFSVFSEKRRKQESLNYANALQPFYHKHTLVTSLINLKKFAANIRAKKDRNIIINMRLDISSQILTRAYYTKWKGILGYIRKSRNMTKIATLLGKCTAMLYIRHHYNNWLVLAERREGRRRASILLEMVLHASNRLLLASSFRRLYSWRCKGKGRKKLTAAAKVLAILSRNRLLELSYRKWTEFSLIARVQNTENAIVRRRSEIASIRNEYSDLSDIIEKRKYIFKIRKEIEKVRLAQQVELERRIIVDQQFTELSNLLVSTHVEYRNNTEKHEPKDHRYLATVMSKLKAKSLNFYSDQELFRVTREKLGKTVAAGAGQTMGPNVALQTAASKEFMESFNVVKRVVSDITKKPYASNGEEWTLSHESVHRFPSHSLTTIHRAIKTMVLVFDIMDTASRESVSGNADILVNEKWLVPLIVECASHRAQLIRGASGKGIVRGRTTASFTSITDRREWDPDTHNVPTSHGSHNNKGKMPVRKREPSLLSPSLLSPSSSEDEEYLLQSKSQSEEQLDPAIGELESYNSKSMDRVSSGGANSFGDGSCDGRAPRYANSPNQLYGWRKDRFKEGR